MSIEPGQLRQAIRSCLRELNPSLLTDNAVELLMLTAAQESHCGRWLWQETGGEKIPKSLAYGIFQMEEPAFKEAMGRVLKYRPDVIPPSRRRLIFDLRLAIWWARCYYLSFSEPLPEADDVLGLALYWKVHWNTRQGTGTVESALSNYRSFAVE